MPACHYFDQERKSHSIQRLIRIAATLLTTLSTAAVHKPLSVGLGAGPIAAALVVAVACVAGAPDTNLAAVASLFPGSS